MENDIITVPKASIGALLARVRLEKITVDSDFDLVKYFRTDALAEAGDYRLWYCHLSGEVSREEYRASLANHQYRCNLSVMLVLIAERILEPGYYGFIPEDDEPARLLRHNQRMLYFRSSAGRVRQLFLSSGMGLTIPKHWRIFPLVERISSP